MHIALGALPCLTVIWFVKARSEFRENDTTRTFLRLHTSPQMAVSYFSLSVRQVVGCTQSTGRNGNVLVQMSIATHTLGTPPPPRVCAVFPELFTFLLSPSLC